MTSFSILCQQNGGCMGCCGNSYPSPEKVKQAIDKNTQEFTLIIKDETNLKHFRDRVHPHDLRHGVCRNLVQEQGKIFCPLHPALNEDHDLRINHCDTNYLCMTARAFEHWTEEKQNAFLTFIHRKKLDNISYSLKMDKGILHQEFEDTYADKERNK